MENYTIEFDTNRIIVKESGKNVYTMRFPIDNVESIIMRGNKDIRKRPFTDMKDFNWKSAGWSIVNMIREESQVFNCITSEVDDSGNIIIRLATEFEGIMSGIELKCLDNIIELIKVIHVMAVQNK